MRSAESGILYVGVRACVRRALIVQTRRKGVDVEALQTMLVEKMRVLERARVQKLLRTFHTLTHAVEMSDAAEQRTDLGSCVCPGGE
jgi:hypothetical protein